MLDLCFMLDPIFLQLSLKNILYSRLDKGTRAQLMIGSLIKNFGERRSLKEDLSAS